MPIAWTFTPANKPGCYSLKQLMYQVENLKEELGKYRPKLAESYKIAEILKAKVYPNE